jgi:hypothetical protein
MVKIHIKKIKWINENVKKSCLLLGLWLMSFSTLPLSAANFINEMSAVTLNGEVSDEKGEPVIGATVQLKGTDIGVATDENGKFSMSVPDLMGTMVVSYIGFKIQQIPIGGRNFIKVILEEDSELLSEVVVIGYGEVKKSDLTGAVASFSSERRWAVAPTPIAARAIAAPRQSRPRPHLSCRSQCHPHHHSDEPRHSSLTTQTARVGGERHRAPPV